MPNITSSLLTDTLNVVALARETALARGVKDQADRLTPVVDGLRTVANAARQPQPAARPTQAVDKAATPAEPAGVLAQGDFQTLLASAQKAPLTTSAAGSSTQDRSQVAAAMAAGGMGEVDIARHLGVSREEIRLMLSNPGSSASRTSWSSVKSYWR